MRYTGLSSTRDLVHVTAVIQKVCCHRKHTALRATILCVYIRTATARLLNRVVHKFMFSSRLFLPT